MSGSISSKFQVHNTQPVRLD